MMGISQHFTFTNPSIDGNVVPSRAKFDYQSEIAVFHGAVTPSHDLRGGTVVLL
jgi:hypothetical protein